MFQEPTSIAEHIECLARLTGAPLTFVDQVRALFVAKGISLEDHATPFLEALEEAFRREETIRHSSVRAKQSINDIQANFRKVGRAYVEQLEQLKKIQSSLQTQSHRLRKKLTGRSSNITHITVNGDHRSFVTKPVREQLPMVPGPKDMQ